VTRFPTGDVAADTARLEQLLYDAAVSGDPVVLSGRWRVNNARLIMPDVYDRLIILGDATIELVDRAGAGGWACPLTIELAQSVGNTIHIGSGLTFSGGGSNQTQDLGETNAQQSSCLRIARNANRDPQNRCRLGLLKVDDLSVTDRISRGLVFSESSPLQWVKRAEITGGTLTGRASVFQRGSIEWGASVGHAELTSVIGDADSFVQTEPEVDSGVTTSILRDCTIGTAEFGGRAEQQRYELHNCTTLTHLNINSANYLIRGGTHRLARTGAWYRSNFDVASANFVLADDVQIVIYHALPNVENIQLVRKIKKCSFMYENPDQDWRAPAMLGKNWNAMLLCRPSETPEKHHLVTSQNVFDARAYTSIYAVGTPFDSDRDNVAGEYAFVVGEFSKYGGRTRIHAEHGNQTAVRGVPLYVNADVPTADFSLLRSGNGWKPGFDAGHGVIDEHAVFDSTAEFHEYEPPVGKPGVKGDTWHYGGKVWEATRTSRSDAEWVETTD
jgi:hypothetical protein